ncbi:amidohydrolase family protein [Hyphococcus sp.]|uniref:amidohydrolase family protein n=1 Tax=Hyphococcus sp. TaxID=2038636 RepID=UPI003CCC195B
MKFLAVLFAAAVSACAKAPTAPYDLVILNGRVIDPETGLDAIRNVGVNGDSVAVVTKDKIAGATTINASGKVVAPGFIDLHAHGQRIPAGRMQALDGVTTALELEVGVLPVAEFYEQAAAEGRPIHYGVAASWAHARIAEIVNDEPEANVEWFTGHFGNTQWQTKIASTEELEGILARLQSALDDGAVGIGFALGYAPGSGRKEYYAANALAAKNNVPTYTHARFLSVTEPDSSFEGFQEMVAVAASTGAHMHISHLNSISLRDIDAIAPMIRGAQENGVTITVEAYPYGAGATSIGAAMFQGPDWQARLGGIKKSDFTVDGEPLSDAEFDRLQADAPSTGVVLHMLHPDDRSEDQAALDKSILYPGGAIASDGGYWSDAGGLIANDIWPMPENAQSHPRAAGTFSKFLRVYVREREAISLLDAIAKTSLIPAQILESAAPQMRQKGRIQVGADADIIVFDLARVSDRANFEKPAQASVGFEHVIVGGTPLVIDGVLDTTVLPGRPIRRSRNPTSES